MSVFVDLQVRKALNDHLLTIGTGVVGSNERSLDLATAGLSGVTAAIQVASGEDGSVEKEIAKDWVEPFLVKSPQLIFTPSDAGMSKKNFQYTIWVKTEPQKGLYFNEALCGLIEQHFKNNIHLTAGINLLTVLKTYQQASITKDSSSSRLFNRVFIDCEIYYNNK